MVRSGEGATVGIERVACFALTKGCDVRGVACFYLHASNQLFPMIGVHPVGRSVIIFLDVGRGPIQLGFKFVFTGW
jgi:hypothetical protein